MTKTSRALETKVPVKFLAGNSPMLSSSKPLIMKLRKRLIRLIQRACAAYIKLLTRCTFKRDTMVR